MAARESQETNWPPMLIRTRVSGGVGPRAGVTRRALARSAWWLASRRRDTPDAPGLVVAVAANDTGSAGAEHGLALGICPAREAVAVLQPSAKACLSCRPEAGAIAIAAGGKLVFSYAKVLIRAATPFIVPGAIRPARLALTARLLPAEPGAAL